METIDKEVLKTADIDNAFSQLGIKTTNTKEVVEQARSNKAIVSTDIKEVKQRKLMTITDADRNLAVSEDLVPLMYQNAKFNEDEIKQNLKRQFSKNNSIRIINFNSYTKICSQILSDLRMGNLPNNSYIIGAPNGFGKTSFAMESIMLMKKLGWLTVPYRSLEELSIIRNREEKSLSEALFIENTYGVYNHQHGVFMTQQELKQYKETKELPNHLKPIVPSIPYYDWTDYINAKCLITFFSGVTSKNVESRMLYQLLTIRSAKGLPTIAMISTSLQPYTQDIKLREEVWDEILSYDESKNSLDRVKHISCYKKKSDYIITNQDGNIDSSTGIVNS